MPAPLSIRDSESCFGVRLKGGPARLSAERTSNIPRVRFDRLRVALRYGVVSRWARASSPNRRIGAGSRSGRSRCHCRRIRSKASSDAASFADVGLLGPAAFCAPRFAAVPERFAFGTWFAFVLLIVFMANHLGCCSGVSEHVAIAAAYGGHREIIPPATIRMALNERPRQIASTSSLSNNLGGDRHSGCGIDQRIRQLGKGAMMTSMTRREALRTGGMAVGGATFMAGMLGSRAAWSQEALLRATHFGGPYEILTQLVAKPFADMKLGHVDYEVEVSPAVVARLQAGRGNPPFDVVMVSRSFGLRALNAGLLEKVGPADFPEASTLIPDAIPAAGWGVAMVIDTFDMMIDTNQVKEPVSSWLDLWKPEFKGKVALPAAANGGAAFAFISCIVRAVGGNDRSPAVINEAFDRLKALKPSVRVFYQDSVQPTQMMDRAEIGIAPQFGIRIANQTKVSPNIVKTTPREGVVAIPYDLCIAKGSKQVDLGKRYINLTVTKGIQEKLVVDLLATPSRSGLVIPPNIQKIVTLDSSHLWFQDEEYAASKQREWLDRYTREVQS